ncbi:MAG: hypothetical protein LLF89_07600, partial [Spirochaetaceae bacterium]|nr:hypothetical protein [Spirochaetaceae bacterium]
PNPAFANIDVPLASTFMLSTKPGKEAYVEPVIENGGYRFMVKVGKPKDMEAAKNGTKLARGANFCCLLSNAVINDPYIKSESMAGRMGAKLMAIVAEGDGGRVYLAPTLEHETVANEAKPEWKPDMPMNRKTSNLVSGRGYGFFTWADLFTSRQLVALDTFSDLVQEAIPRIEQDAIVAGLKNDGIGLEAGGTGAQAYAEAVGVYLGFAIDKGANYWSSICAWSTSTEKMISTFSRQAIPMVWDFTEANPFSTSSGNWDLGIEQAEQMLESLGLWNNGFSSCTDAQRQGVAKDKIVSTDPPYYDNIGYADLSDFFYIWLRHSLRSIFPSLFSTLSTPKSDELVATPYRHENKEEAEQFFLDGMTKAMNQLVVQAHPAFPVTIYYAFKQSENQSSEGVTNTGWETFLEAVIKSGFSISGTWPMRTEYTGNLKKQMSALASSIVLVCRRRNPDAPVTTRREFIVRLKAELPAALAELQKGNIAPVDLAQAAIGPGMAIYTSYAKVLDSEDKPLSVRQALTLINQVLDEPLAEQEGDYDTDSRFALAWFEQYGFSEGEFGVADVLARAKDTSVSSLVDACILFSKQGKVRLLKPAELSTTWNPEVSPRISAWEIAHQLIRALESGGETAAAHLVAAIGSDVETARDLAYRLYNLCERKRRPQEALSYNSLVQSWPEILRLSKEVPRAKPGELFG